MRLLTRFSIQTLAFLVFWQGCSERFTNEPLENKAPETYLSLQPDVSLRRTSSQQHIRWWGADEDGLVVGFVFSFDSLSWHFTPRNDSIFALRLNTTDTTYSFFVSAIDNGGNGRYDASGPRGAEPYVDLNANGRWDEGEPFTDFGAVDPTPATLHYPIQNTPPVVSFLLSANVPDTTYPVATFQWNATDFDGSGTIDSFYIAVDDTLAENAWQTLPGSFNRVTLFHNRTITPADPITYRSASLPEGLHVFYLKAKDVAGAFSATIRMPDENRTWYVRHPKGDFLIVDDYLPSDFSTSFYTAMFDTLMGGRLGSRDVWDIKKGATAIKRGDNMPPLINPTFTESIKLFKYIFWYSDNSPSLEIAQSSLPGFVQAGGKVMFSAGLPENVSGQGSLVDFAPIENVEPSFFTNRLNASDTVETSFDPAYPTLVRDNLGTIYAFPRGVIPKVNARVLYRMMASPRWAGQPIMGVKDADQPSFVMLSLILHRFGTPPDNAAALLRKVYKDEFGIP